MSDTNKNQESKQGISRRRLLTAGVVGAAGLGASGLLGRASDAIRRQQETSSAWAGGTFRNGIVPFYDSHQGGIATPAQLSTYMAAFDLTTSSRSRVAQMLQDWTEVAARMTKGETAKPLRNKLSQAEPDSGEAIGLGPARLTVTVGFGASLFRKNGVDRYGLASRRPAALVDLPVFPGDQLQDAYTGGDLTVQACADDPQVAFHAVRQLARIADGTATLRWLQNGFNTATSSVGVQRNPLGFRDGIMNPDMQSPAASDLYVWAGKEAPVWMRGGSYLVMRRIRLQLEHWDTMTLGVQQSVIGRYKVSGAPLGQPHVNDALDLDAKDAQGNLVIPATAHVRVAAPQSNGGKTILRRGYSYNDGLDPFVERWPPWKQALEYDAGLLFFAYQKDPRQGFIPIFNNLALNDALNEFATHIGSILVACPPAAPSPGHWIGEKLFEA